MKTPCEIEELCTVHTVNEWHSAVCFWSLIPWFDVVYFELLITLQYNWNHNDVRSMSYSGIANTIMNSMWSFICNHNSWSCEVLNKSSHRLSIHPAYDANSKHRPRRRKSSSHNDYCDYCHAEHTNKPPLPHTHTHTTRR